MQYGLAALDSGAITPAQFATLNADIGGMNFAGVEVPQRTEASLAALRAVYADDLVNSASLGLRTTPVIDQRLDLDFFGLAGADIHTTDWSFVMRARMLAANGTDGNQVIIENMPTLADITAADTYELAQMDAWLTNIENDHSHQSQQQKVLDDKPATLTDGCFMSGSLVDQTLTDPSAGQCGAAYPVASNPRLVAGEPLTMPALKCSLKPLDFADYPVTFTAAEQAELRQAFPTGVCDYDQPGVGVQAPIASWLSYGDNPDGVIGPFPLPPPPVR
jgi:hypothetical protein